MVGQTIEGTSASACSLPPLPAFIFLSLSLRTYPSLLLQSIRLCNSHTQLQASMDNGRSIALSLMAGTARFGYCECTFPPVFQRPLPICAEVFFLILLFLLLKFVHLAPFSPPGDAVYVHYVRHSRLLSLLQPLEPRCRLMHVCLSFRPQCLYGVMFAVGNRGMCS